LWIDRAHAGNDDGHCGIRKGSEGDGGEVSAAAESIGRPAMAHVYLFIVRKLVREKMIAATDNPLLTDFAIEYEAGLRPSERMAKFAPPINKLAPIIRTTFNQTANLPLIELMNDAIIIVDLDKGKIGDMNAALIGSAIANHIGIYAFHRPALRRQELAIMVDEFQTFSHGINWMPSANGPSSTAAPGLASNLICQCTMYPSIVT
jgi:hypothetical protein